MRTALLLVVLTGCPKPEPGVVPDDPEPACVSALTGQAPVDGAVDVAVGAVIELQFSAPPNPNWAMGVAGVDGRIEVAPNGLTAVFTPEVPFAEDTLYTVTVSVCETTTQSTFRTTTEPVLPVVGDTFELPFDDLVWLAPNSSPVFTALIQFDSFLMEITSIAADGGSFEAAFTAGWPLGEPECPSAVAIEADYTGNPVFTTTSGVLDIPVEDAPVPLVIHIDDFIFTGRFTAAGGLENVRFTGRIDTRPFDELLGGPGATCDLAALAGDVCAPCEDAVSACLLLDVAVDAAVRSFGPGITGPCGL